MTLEQTLEQAPPVATRALATVETITDISHIPGADNIVTARIRGWDVVVKRGEFVVGDRCVYLEVDSLLDVADDRFAFLAARGVRTDVDGVYGHVLKTVRLRGQYSQGLAFPLADFPELDQDAPAGTDVTADLPVVKWEPPVPMSLTGQVRGMRPSWIPMTDEDRVQNVPGILHAAGEWVATEKLDGRSTTFYVDPVTGIDDGVCTRNLDLLPDPDNTLVQLGARYGIHAALAAQFPGARAVVQGEAYGEGIQGNPLKLRGQHFAAFTLRVDGRELPRDQWPHWLAAIAVPTYDFPFPATVEQALAQVEKLDSLRSPGHAAEGVVWRTLGTPSATLPDGMLVRGSMKVISNRYLLKHDR